MKQYSLIEEAAVLNEVAWGTLLKATGKRLTQGNFGDKLQTLKSFGGNVIRNMTGPQSATRQFVGGAVRSSNAAHTGRNLLSAAKMRGTNAVAATQMASKGQRLVNSANQIAKHLLARTAKTAALNTGKALNAAGRAVAGATGAAARGIGATARVVGKGVAATGSALNKGAKKASAAISNASRNAAAKMAVAQQNMYK